MSPTATNIIARRESLGEDSINAPLAESEQQRVAEIVRRLQRRNLLQPPTQRESPGGEAGLLVIFDDKGKISHSASGE